MKINCSRGVYVFFMNFYIVNERWDGWWFIVILTDAVCYDCVTCASNMVIFFSFWKNTRRDVRGNSNRSDCDAEVMAWNDTNDFFFLLSNEKIFSIDVIVVVVVFFCDTKFLKKEFNLNELSQIEWFFVSLLPMCWMCNEAFYARATMSSEI